MLFRIFSLRDAVFFGLSACLILFYVASAQSGFPLDDSWIHQVYGRNLAEYREWAFIPGIPSAASTSPFYTILLAIGYKLGVTYQVWTHLVGIIALSLTAMIGTRLSERLLSPAKWTPLITGLTLILTWHLIWAAASGMETMLFGMFTLLLIHLLPKHERQLSIGQGMQFGIIAALSASTRPEGMVLAGIGGVFTLVSYRLKSIRWCIGAVIGFACFISPYLLLNLNLTGNLLPNTATAKQAEYAPLLQKSYLSRFVSMLFPVLVGGQILLLPGVLYFYYHNLRDFNRQSFHRFVPLIWVIALVALYAARLPAAYQHGRYTIPLLPALIVIGVAGTYLLIQQSRYSISGRVLTRSLVIAATITFIYFALGLGAQVYTKDVKIINEEMVTPARWIADNIPPDELLAVHDIGAVGYFAPRPILDLAGLVSEEVIPIIGDADALWNLMQTRNAQYLMAFTDQIPGQNPDDPRLCPLYQSNGKTALNAGGTKMTVYQIAWEGCSD